ncbi:MAG: hypothetical protein ACLQU1_31375 [Bryobacteraceae bacterium]
MKKTLFGGKWRSAASALMLCLALAAAVALVKRGNAFTLIELILKFDPVEITSSQTSHIVFNNTFGSQTVHAEFIWFDVISGNMIGAPYQADVAAGHGAIALLLPAVTVGTNAAVSSQAIYATITLSPGPNGQSLPQNIAGQIGATMEVVDKATGAVTVARGLSLLPAVQ